MAARMEQKVVRYFTLFLFLCTAKLVLGNTCPQQEGRSSSSRINQKARNLAGSGVFYVQEDGDPYQYTINLCPTAVEKQVAIMQRDNSRDNSSEIQTYVVGKFENARVFGGTGWLMIQYSGEKYNTHCGGAARKGIIFIQCDRYATTYKKRQPRMLEEYRTKGKDVKDKEFCYYLFEMRHDGVCPPEKTKISPGSVFIIIVVIVGVLYLVLGLLYQRFIVGAKGMEQLPNYLMWREFGSLQADGCNYICRCEGTRKPTRYKPVDDAIADDEEDSVNNDDNDDAMLPM